MTDINKGLGDIWDKTREKPEDLVDKTVDNMEDNIDDLEAKVDNNKIEVVDEKSTDKQPKLLHLVRASRAK